MYSHRIRTTVLWLAVVAMLWAALAPSLSAAMSPATGKAWAEVCIAGGTRLVAVGADQASDKPAGIAAPRTHCIFCIAQEDQAIVAPQAGWVMQSAIAVERILPSFEVPLQLAAADRTAHLSRAPPRFA